MKYRLVIFDFDGTLSDSFLWFSGSLNILADIYQFRRVESGEPEMLRGLDTREIVKYLRVPFWKIPRIAAHMRALMNRNAQQIRPFQGAGMMLKNLADRGAKLGLVSSNSLANIRRILGMESTGLFTYIEQGVSIFGKAAQLRKILRKSRIPAAETIYIGDETRDLEAARAVGIQFGAVAWGYAHLEALKSRHPDEVFLNIWEISERLGEV